MPVDHEQFSNLRVFEHPLVHDKLSRARNAATQPAQFRRLLNEIAGLMTYEVCRELKTARTTVRTPMGETSGLILDEPVTLVPILRAGIGMTDGILALLPEARVGHIGLYRDENTLEPVEYYAKMPPDVTEGVVLLVDPMLATGGSASAAVTLLKRRGCRRIRLICLVSAPEGVARLERDHPDVVVYSACLDESLNEEGYIVPGLGDAGDRLFGTQ
ncbi:MAG: uracil phosphoribosyltransferase [Planctomycetota bacterium]|nr:uracil phosphoribosyltransferase [Planctomycetota bacterium]MEC9157448.1 uracil phosphoribosyltransferase [Planctomycetota bacterium]MED5506384.1 uracil phosphoribosyltransferase [Planctomycetota bacterium]